MEKNMKPSLAKANRKLAREWHPTKNAPLTPRDVTYGSNNKIWWTCAEGHEWRASVHARTGRGNGCPYCAGRAVGKDNCLRARNPKLAREWHPTRNAPLTPDQVAAGTAKKAWWICKKGHEWEAEVNSRNRGTGCPYCAGNRVSKDNCLQTVNPALAAQWHPTKNAPLTPRDVVAGTWKKAWWICKSGHVWKTPIASRNQGSGCPLCSGRRPTKENSLEVKGPRLAGEWHPTKNGSWTPKDVSPFSRRNVWWQCEKGHEHYERIIVRYKREGCPECTLKARAPRLFETT